ncbi:Uncharacterised protein [Leclercia adecarboxylata]|uniref:Uncharacterized protein n=1 Tax=Leclercia adecarboxylata TaxID=83655 RepID=A0A4U9HFW2_9ENTR|nr:Uncharacterised protein [Leclercia adecarboxylata]
MGEFGIYRMKYNEVIFSAGLSAATLLQGVV